LASIFNPALDPTGTAVSRKAAILASLPIMMQNPFLGVGLGMSGVAMHEKGLVWRPVHNVYLQFGTEVGIPAMILFIVLLFRLTKSMRDIQVFTANEEKNREINLFARALEASLIGFAIGGFFYPVSYHFYFYYPAGFSLALKKIYAASRSEPATTLRYR
jgi:O-antigen ligase